MMCYQHSEGMPQPTAKIHLPFLLAFVAVGHHISVGPVTIKLQHFSPGGFCKFGLKKVASLSSAQLK